MSKAQIIMFQVGLPDSGGQTSVSKTAPSMIVQHPVPSNYVNESILPLIKTASTIVDHSSTRPPFTVTDLSIKNTGKTRFVNIFH